MTESITILGTGPAGLTAAIYAARANLKPLCVEGDQPGGQLTITSEVENYPGFPDGVDGNELMSAFRKQAERFGTRFETGQVVRVDLKKVPIEMELASGKVIATKTLVIATGASAKWLGIESEKKFMAKGVSACATCDGFFFRNQDVVVVGGGDTAMEEANYLTRFAKKVTLIHRRDSFRASKVMVDRARKNPKIEIVYNSAIDEILGDKLVSSVRVKNLVTQELTEIQCQGVFVAIGHEPNTKIFRDQLPCNDHGYLLVEPGTTKTKIPGVFVAGDASDPIYRQAVTSAGTGCMAAIDAERYLESVGS